MQTYFDTNSLRTGAGWLAHVQDKVQTGTRLSIMHKVDEADARSGLSATKKKKKKASSKLNSSLPVFF